MSHTKKPTWAWPIYFLLVTLISKLYLIYLYGNSTPYWDQWDGEADIYKWYLEGTLTLKVMLGSFNEHRILLTRVLGISLLEINNKIWDPKLEMYVNAFLHISSWIIYIKILLENVNKNKAIIITFSAIILIVPFGFENTLAGFQSQFYLMILLSMILIERLFGKNYKEKNSWINLFISILLVFTIASGVITLIASIICLILYGIKNKFTKFNFITIFYLSVIAFLAIIFTPIISDHDNGKSHTIAQFFLAFYKAASWPVEFGLLGVLVNLPLFIYIINFVLLGRNKNILKYEILCIGLWVFGQYFSASYMRAIVITTSRYLDLYSLALPLNLTCLILIQNELKYSIKYKNIIVMTYILLIILSLFFQLPKIMDDIINKDKQSRIQEFNVASYLCSHDDKFIQNKAHLEIPYPDFMRLKNQLEDCTISKILKINKCISSSQCN